LNNCQIGDEQYLMRERFVIPEAPYLKAEGQVGS